MEWLAADEQGLALSRRFSGYTKRAPQRAADDDGVPRLSLPSLDQPDGRTRLMELLSRHTFVVLENVGEGEVYWRSLEVS